MTALKTEHRTNVGQIERYLSAGVGGGLVLYGLAARSPVAIGLSLLGGGLLYRGLTGRCEVYRALGVTTATESDKRGLESKQGVKCETSIVIERPPAEVYGFWRHLANLPQVIEQLESVEELDARRSHWSAKGPFNASLEWDAEIINDRENELIAWESVAESDVDTAGSVHFDPILGNKMTLVRSSFRYDPPAGKVGAVIAEWLGTGAEVQLDRGLRHLKELLESRSTQ